VIFDRVRQPLSPSDIRAVEEELKITIPGDLREFYLLNNGGRPHPGFFPKGGDWYEVHQFLPMKTSDRNVGFEETYKDLVLGTPEFPKGFIPFAVDEAGDYFLYCIKGDAFGEIMFNQSDYTDDPGRFIIFLAPDLASFVKGLAEPD
jgi:cell wall assembly regulator SMI1